MLYVHWELAEVDGWQMYLFTLVTDRFVMGLGMPMMGFV